MTKEQIIDIISRGFVVPNGTYEMDELAGEKGSGERNHR